ncbi:MULTISPECIES: HutD family protein [unclassified Brevibacterium]|uniref:HutD family protein n=1 Tax=unclassified Brevibacterium TaxID=2614124 RepID=UPI0014850C6F|nr:MULTISPECIES: HutD family protein [unclassified Brevibacterium]MCM1013858.1 HutD family protein [Brevibacterium sp. XM4083]
MEIIASFVDIVPVPWANGAGETTELVSLDASTALTPDRRPWRLSIARLERTGPFSSLPGLDRTFLPTDAEVVLDIAGTAHRAGPGSPLRFSGSDAVALTDLAGPTFAVNLMVVADEAALPPLTMTLDPEAAGTSESARPRFALALADGPDWRRFDLLRLGDGDAVGPGDRLGGIGFA